MKKLLTVLFASLLSVNAFAADFFEIECSGPESEMGYSDSIFAHVDGRGYDAGSVISMNIIFGEDGYQAVMEVAGINLFESEDGFVVVDFSESLETATVTLGGSTHIYKCNKVD